MIGANGELTFILALSKVHTVVCALGFFEHQQNLRLTLSQSGVLLHRLWYYLVS